LNEHARGAAGSQESIAHWRDNQVSYQSIDLCQCLLDTSSVPAVGNVEFCGYLLMRELN
jgi:hypothetical protein